MPRKHSVPDTSSDWRAGTVEEYSPAFGRWVRLNKSVTVKPGESLAAVTREVALELRMNDYCAPPRVRIAVWSF